VAKNHLARHPFGSKLRRIEALPLPAGKPRQPGETNLDDGGAFSGEVAKEWVRNQASRGFPVPAKALPGVSDLWLWNEYRKGLRQRK
jgi:hypothetical protein